MFVHWILVLLLPLVFCLPPANDLCSGATRIVNLPYTTTGTTVGSTRNNNCPIVFSTSTNPFTAGDVYYSFTPASTMLVDVSLCGSVLDTNVFIASGSCSSMTCLIASDDNPICGTLSTSSYVQAMPMFQGVTYFIIVSGYRNNVGAYSLSVTQNTGAGNCATARSITSLPFTSDRTTVSTLVQATPCRTGASTWYTYTPKLAVSARITTCNSGTADSYVAVAKGTCPYGLSCIGGNGNNISSCRGNGGLLTDLILYANTQYFIIVTTGSFGAETDIPVILQISGEPFCTMVCPPDLAKVADPVTCKYSGSTGNPIIQYLNNDLGPTDVSYSKSPKAPYSVGVTMITFTANLSGGIADTCQQKLTVLAPPGANCIN